jgi:hypothetical protein
MMFAIASFAAAIGVLDEWTRTLFRIYYLFGAILNVPVLGLGTIYLLGPRRAGHVAALLILVGSIYAAGAVFTASMNTAPLEVAGIPSGRDVLPDSVRALSRYFSYAGFIVVVAGALWSAWRMSRSRSAHLKNLTIGNVFIAAGTFVVALAGVFARYGQGAVFSMALLAGVALMFWGFLKTRSGRGRTHLMEQESE